MFFSIIIPVYNVESYLNECLDSVLSQTCTDWEAVCVNDGSTDGSAAILDDYAAKDERVKVITQPNSGLSAARNAGIKAAKGDYVILLDGDDWLEPNALKIIADSLGDEDMLCFSGCRYIEDTKSFNPADNLPEKAYACGMDYYNENALRKRDFAFVCAVLRAYKRSFLLDNRLRFKEGIVHEDNLFTPIACFYARKVRQVNDSLYVYRLRTNSITTTPDMRHVKDMLGVANELAAFFIPKQNIDKSVIYRAITHHFQVAFLHSSKKNRKEMKQICDWDLYKTVSRTKLRHRWNYLKNLYIM